MTCSAISFHWWLVTFATSQGIAIGLLLYGTIHRAC